MSGTRSSKRGWALGASLVAVTAAGTGQAQDANDAGAANNEIVVTAQFREQNL